MGTTIRPELSSKKQYWIERHRYYELKHFCLQYPIWRKEYNALAGLRERSFGLTGGVNTNLSWVDPTAGCASARVFYADRMKMIEKLTVQADPELADYILKGVTEGLPYDALKARFCIPCGKDTYYDRYRRFFWLLSQERR